VPSGDFSWMQNDSPLNKQVCQRCGHVVEFLVDARAILRRQLPTVLIVTTANVERKAILDVLEEPCADAIGRIPVKLGKFGGRVVVVCQTQQGISHTQTVVSNLLGSNELKGNVKLVLPVGVAWGARPESRRDFGLSCCAQLCGSKRGGQRVGDISLRTRCSRPDTSALVMVSRRSAAPSRRIRLRTL